MRREIAQRKGEQLLIFYVYNILYLIIAIRVHKSPLLEMTHLSRPPFGVGLIYSKVYMLSADISETDNARSQRDTPKTAS